jgi:hypothetical protein
MTSIKHIDMITSELKIIDKAFIMGCTIYKLYQYKSILMGPNLQMDF